MSGISPQLSQALTGISSILVTPFDDQDRIAPDRLRPIIERAVDAGVHIFVANGNTSARAPAGWPLTDSQQSQMHNMLSEWGVITS